MTQLAAQLPDIEDTIGDVASIVQPPQQRLPKPLRRAYVDSIVEENRKATPVSAVNQRAVKRVSISELNDLDIDEIRRRYNGTKVDTRGPVTRFLDLIDVPRNTIARTIGAVTGTNERKFSEGDTAAFGAPRVNFSDILDDLGVHNRVIRGVVGLVGDVALDPLTYVGPPGWGLKLGKAATLTRPGRAAIMEAVEAAKLGRVAADPTVAKYAASIGHTGETLAARAAAGEGEAAASELANSLMGGIPKKRNKAMSALLGDDLHVPGESKLADHISRYTTAATDDAERASIDAAQELYRKYGRAYGPGVRVVKDPTKTLGVRFTTDAATPHGSGVLHIPFSDYQVSLPAFTSEARSMGAVASLAKNSASAFHEPTELTEAVNLAATRFDDIENQLKYVNDPDIMWTPEAQTKARNRAKRDLNDALGEIHRTVRRTTVSPLSDAASVMHANDVYRAYDARLRQLALQTDEAEQDFGEVKKLWDKVIGEDIPQEVEQQLKARRASHAAAMKDPLSFPPELSHFDEDAERRNILSSIMERVRDNPETRVNDETFQRILSMDKTDIDRMADYVDLLQKRRDAAFTIAAASQTPVMATLSGRDKAMANAARMALGLTDEEFGSTFLSTLASAADSIGNHEWKERARRTLQDVAAYGKQTLGLGAGQLKDYQRDYAKSLSLAQTGAYRQVANDLDRSIRALGLKPTDRATAGRLVTALIFLGDRDPNQLAASDQAARDIVEAIQSGILRDPEVYDGLKQVTAKYRNSLDQIRTENGIEHYFPGVLTGESQQRIRQNLENVPGIKASQAIGGGGETPLVAPRERFTKPRSSIEYTFVNPATGQEEKYIGAMDAYSQYGDTTKIPWLTPEDKSVINENQRVAAAWRNLTEEQRLRATKTILSPQEINRRVKEDGLFKHLINGKLDGDFFETDAALALAARFGGEERKHYIENFQRALQMHELPDTNAKLASFDKQSHAYTTEFGVKGTAYKDGKGRPILEVGSQRYRRLAQDRLPADISHLTLTAEGKGNHILNSWYPEEIADLIEDSAGVFKDDEKLGEFAVFADEVAKIWKVTTLTHPSWTINDLIGGLHMAVSSGRPIPALMKRAKDAMRVTRAMAANDTEGLAKMAFEFAGRQTTGEGIAASPIHMFLGGHGPAEAIGHVSPLGGATFSPRTYSNGEILKSLVHGDTAPLRQDAGELLAAAKQRADAASEAAQTTAGGVGAGAKTAQFDAAAAGLKTAYKAVVDEGLKRRIWEPWARLNGIANDWVRTMTYMSLLDEGHDAASAAQYVNNHLLDMSVLTSFDRRARKLVPFYNWIKASGVYGMRQALENPKFFSVVPHLRDAIETATNGEANLLPQQRPSWLRDQQALQIGSDPDNRQALTLTSSLPTEAATYGLTALFSPLLGGGALQDVLGYGVNSLSPLAKVWIELGAKRNLYTKQTIDSGGKGDMTPTEYLLGQVRPLRELGVGSIRQSPISKAFSQGPVTGVSRLLLGGRLQPLDEERRLFQLQRDADDVTNAFRKRIAVAERDGNKAESLRSRVLLLRHFQNMQQNGLKIPVWAAGQIQQVNAQR